MSGKVLTPARPDEIDLVHHRLMEAIELSPFYCDRFKAYEEGRLTKGSLRRLAAIDPEHVLVTRAPDGAVSGFMISGPQLGTLWLYWSYLFPEYRRSRAALDAMSDFVKRWDNGRFHKIATYARPENETAIAIMKRYGWKQIALLENHIFGEDYLLFERPLEKTEPGYDEGLGPSFLGRMRTLVEAAMEPITGIAARLFQTVRLRRGKIDTST